MEKRKNDEEPADSPWLSYILVVAFVLIGVVIFLSLLGPNMCSGVFSNISKGLNR